MGNSKVDLINIKKSNKLYGQNTNKLLNFFNVGVSDKGNLIPTEHVRDKNGKELPKVKPIDMPSAMESAYQYLVSNMSTAPYMDNAFRFLRYKDMKSACTTEPILETAVKIYTSEAYTSDYGKNLVQIKAKDSKLEKYFYKWFEDVGFTENVIRDIFTNLVMYGDAFWLNGIDMEGNGGITTITPIDPFLVADRIEFNIGMVEEKRQWFQMALNLANTYPSLQQIVDIVSQKNVEDISALYKSYLFGYTLKLWAEEENDDSQDVKNVKGVPPWCIAHCRLFTTDKDFFPFGKPMFLSAIPTFKSYKTTQLLVDMLRSQSFPREHYSIKCDENSDPFTRNMRISEAKNFLEGITPQTQNQDGLSVGAKIYSCDGLVDYDLLDPSIDLDALGDLEEKKYSMCMSTGIPMTYLCPEEGDGLGGDNAEKLYYLNKIFQRRVDALRRAFLEELDETFRMHLLLTEEFDGDKSEFELSILNPVEDMTSDKISQISDVFSLAKDILDTLATSFGLERGESLSPKIVKSVLSMYLPLEKDLISQWVDEVYGCAEEENKDDNNEDEEGKPKDNMFGKKPNLFESLQEKQIIEKCEGKLNEEYFRYKKEHGMTEGQIGNRYYYNNTYRLKAHYKYTSLYFLKEEIQTQKAKRIQEEMEKEKK
jgi:hypothetical protein